MLFQIFIEYKEKYPKLEYVMNTNWIDVNLNMNPMIVKYILNISQNILKKDLDRCKAKNIPNNILEDIESFISKNKCR